MHPLGPILIIFGLLQAAGAASGSQLYRTLPHFRRSSRLLGDTWAARIHTLIGLIATAAGLLILVGVIEVGQK